jgi:hypothetical protein
MKYCLVLISIIALTHLTTSFSFSVTGEVRLEAMYSHSRLNFIVLGNAEKREAQDVIVMRDIDQESEEHQGVDTEAASNAGAINGKKKLALEKKAKIDGPEISKERKTKGIDSKAVTNAGDIAGKTKHSSGNNAKIGREIRKANNAGDIDGKKKHALKEKTKKDFGPEMREASNSGDIDGKKKHALKVKANKEFGPEIREASNAGDIDTIVENKITAEEIVMEVEKVSENGENYIQFCFSDIYKDELNKFFMADDGFMTFGICNRTKENLCNNTVKECYLINSGSSAIIKLTFEHKVSTTELALSNDTRTNFILKSWDKLVKLEYGGNGKLYNQKVLFLCLKLYYSDNPIPLIESIDTSFGEAWNKFVNVLPRIFELKIPQKDTINEELVISHQITIFLTVLKEELFMIFQDFLNVEHTDYTGGFSPIYDALAYVRESGGILQKTEIDNPKNSDKLAELFRQKIHLSIELIKDYEVPVQGTNIKMMILLRLFWNDFQVFVPRKTYHEFPFDYLMESIFASFFTKSILCHNESIDALSVLKRRPIKLWVYATTKAPQTGYKGEIYHLAHIEEYLKKLDLYMIKTLDEPLKELMQSFKENLRKN